MTSFHYGHYTVALTISALANFQWDNVFYGWILTILALTLFCDDVIRVNRA